jgi:phage terminase large subunit GpA-like protein
VKNYTSWVATKKFLVICPNCGKERHVCYRTYHYRKSDLCHHCSLVLQPRIEAMNRGKRLKNDEGEDVPLNFKE